MPRSKTANPLYSAEPMKRSRTPLPYVDDFIPPRTASPSTWVAEQQREQTQLLERHARAMASLSGSSTGTHIIEQKWTFAGLDAAEQKRLWEEQTYEVDMQARMWMLQEEARRIAAMREVERTRLVREEVHRIQVKIRRKREIERQRILEERRRLHEEEEKEWERRRNMAVDRAMSDAWSTYEKRWATILTTSDSLSFASIPWPMLCYPSSPSSISCGAISAFLLSQTHSTNQSPKERIKEALRRWHPDRFGRLLKRVLIDEMKVVEEAVGIVARCLNELLSGQVTRT
ncbi:hypothetical protein EW145_g5905 [Phellinidium pouzarii]|uniref:Uncharacterized protein n=1 Tax=Phellinidium pouzarii TaxID=167371 RepID=A0A4S4KYW7_9AGAM|nr:hypothetical protein EW145_g5905 [Phellinidium pouzarii]